MSNVHVDPDLGPTKKSPSTQDQLDRTELATRALKLKHYQKQTAMIEEANRLTSHPKSKQEA